MGEKWRKEQRSEKLLQLMGELRFELWTHSELSTLRHAALNLRSHPFSDSGHGGPNPNALGRRAPRRSLVQGAVLSVRNRYLHNNVRGPQSLPLQLGSTFASSLRRPKTKSLPSPVNSLDHHCSAVYILYLLDAASPDRVHPSRRPVKILLPASAQMVVVGTPSPWAAA